jgi:hypothetical protein
VGRQINFYFDTGNEESLLNAAIPEGYGLYEINDLPEPKPTLRRRHDELSTARVIPRQLAICHRDHLAALKFVELSGDGSYYLELDDSWAIEYSPPYSLEGDRRLVSGRLWYEHKYWSTDKDGNDVQIEKPEELKKLYESLARWIRKRCKRLPDGSYIAPGAQILVDEGAELV